MGYTHQMSSKPKKLARMSKSLLSIICITSILIFLKSSSGPIWSYATDVRRLPSCTYRVLLPAKGQDVLPTSLSWSISQLHSIEAYLVNRNRTHRWLKVSALHIHASTLTYHSWKRQVDHRCTEPLSGLLGSWYSWVSQNSDAAETISLCHSSALHIWQHDVRNIVQ